jgi:hypothetical protein
MEGTKMNNFNFQLNEDVYIKARKTVGRIYEVQQLKNCKGCANTCNNCQEAKDTRWVQLLVGPNTLVQGFIYDIEPVASTIYKVGDKVMSLLGGGFVGRVTAIEHDTNRVVCMSLKNPHDRTRYAYALDEIVAYAPIEFKLGQKFRINDKQQIIIMGTTDNKSDRCNIYNAQTLKIMFTNVLMVNDINTLSEKYNIKKLEVLD